MGKLTIRLTVLLVGFILISAPSYATMLAPMPGEFYYRGKTKSMLDRRFHNIMRQKYDFSCGSAALASMLTYHYNRPVDEKAVIEAMYQYGDQDKIRKEGFSLLDMKKYLQTLGLRANGYQESLDKLVKVGIPAIVLINKNGYLHFVLVQGVTKDRVLIGDPTRGSKILKRKEFEAIWQNRILFVIDDDVKLARKTFNTVYAWKTKSLRDYSMPLTNANLGSLTLFTAFSPNTYAD